MTTRNYLTARQKALQNRKNGESLKAATSRFLKTEKKNTKPKALTQDEIKNMRWSSIAKAIQQENEPWAEAKERALALKRSVK